MPRLILLTIILFTAAGAHAEVPHVFAAGSPAVAQQVNENFSSLDSRVAGLEDSTCAGTGHAHSISYSARPSSVGDEITFVDNTYRMIKIPFVEFATGTRYTIVLPARIDPSGSLFTHLHTFHGNLAGRCLLTTVAGYPAQVVVDERRSIFVANNSGTNSNSDYSINANLQILVNETLVSVFMSVRTTEQEQLVATGDYDFSDNLDTGLMLHRDNLIFAVDDLIDYVAIQAEP